MYIFIIQKKKCSYCLLSFNVQNISSEQNKAQSIFFKESQKMTL